MLFHLELFVAASKSSVLSSFHIAKKLETSPQQATTSTAVVGHHLGQSYDHESNLKLGVSEKGGTFNASVLEGNKYVWRTIETVTVESLLRAFGIAHVDFLFLDIEGAEYSVLPVLSTQTSELNETFCQVCGVYIEGCTHKFEELAHGLQKGRDLELSRFMPHDLNVNALSLSQMYP